MRRTVAATALLLTAGCLPATHDSAPAPTPRVSETYTVQKHVEPTTPTRPAASKPATTKPAPIKATGLLFPAANGDGDSWKDTHGVEYRLGLINTPELSECYGEIAKTKRQQLTKHGFRAKSYQVDRYKRHVSVVTLADGTNLNVYLARNGYANDRYLTEFRSENMGLASQLDVAFAAAKREKLGLWKACATTSKPQSFAGSTSSTCHPDYVTCIPIKGDGSGNGSANDLDCGDIQKKVQVRNPGTDPYRLDVDGNGYGCERYG